MKVPKLRSTSSRNSVTPSNQPVKGSTANDDKLAASPSCATFILRSCKAGGYEGGDASTINESSIYTSTESTQFASSWMDPESVAAVNSSGISKASAGVVSSASTLPMGSGKNPRARRPRMNRTIQSRHPPVDDGSSAMDPGPLWRPATEESKVRRFSLKSGSEESSNGSAPVPVKFVDMNQGFDDAENETKHDPPMTSRNSTRQRHATKPAATKPPKEAKVTHGKGSQPAVSYRFEFGDVVLSNGSGRPVDLDDDVCGSVYSFSFSQDDEGTGFELDEFQEIWDGGSQANADSRDESSESSSTFDLESGMHMTDRDLMDRCNSPGAIRLTQEGLNKHEKDKFKETLKDQPDDPFEAWKHSHDARKFIRQRHAEKQENDSDPKVRDQGGEALPPPPPPKPLQKQSSGKRKNNVPKLMQFRKNSGPVEEELAGLSLDQLEAIEQNQLRTPPSFSKNRSEESRSLGLKHIFKKRSGRYGSTAQTVLDREREFAEQEENKKEEQRQKQEKERIEAKRRAYIESQRSREGLIHPQNSPQEAVFLSSGESTATPISASAKSQQASSASALPPCVVCNHGERTHIAMPCMHFSFCAACAIRLGDQSEGHCPVCFEPNVKYAAVSV